MHPSALIAFSVIGGIGLLGVILGSVMTAVRRKLDALVEARFDRSQIMAATTRANFVGQLSKGGRQIRGNGALVLTRDTLCFIRALPEKTFRLPIAAIAEVSLPRSFAGKSVLAKLLCVRYNGDEGSDAMAWALKNPGRWKTAIEQLMAAEGQASKG